MRRFVLGIAVAVTSLAPAAVQADDQQIADFIKGRLQTEQQQGNLRGFNVDMRVDRGTVWFDGHVSNSQQETLILKTAQQAGHLGVVQVVDDINIDQSSAIPSRVEPALAQVPAAMPMVQQVPAQMDTAAGMRAQQVQYQQQRQVAPAAQSAPPAPMNREASLPQEYMGESYGESYGGEIISSGNPMPFASCGGAPMGGAPMGGPAPMAAGYGGGASEAPNLPGYAWPGYASHPNYGALTYPKQYSASAWPYIGPFYPYPQVPLGWRKVSMEWDDGWWFLDFHDK